MPGNEFVVEQMRVRETDAINFGKLATAHRLMFIETPHAFHQPLSPQHFMQAGNATTEVVGGIEDGSIAVCHFHAEAQ